MPLGLRWGTVSSINERVDGLVRLEVDGDPCIAYPRLTGPVEEGDVVLVNVQATELGLGSGGFDVLYANLTRGLRLPPEQGAHVMALPYAPGQLANRYAEEDDDAALERIDVPVVCLGLHSQLAPACAALRGRRVTYVQLAGGALPVSLSDTVRALRARRLLETTIAVAPCLDADVQCVSVAGAPDAGGGARCGGRRLRDRARASSAAARAGATAASRSRRQRTSPTRSAGVRWSLRGSRSATSGSATGVSRTTRARPSRCASATCAWRGLTGSIHPTASRSSRSTSTAGSPPARRSPLSHMGRGPDDDPWFFAAAYAAGRLAGS